jgi:hypothetical protein
LLVIAGLVAAVVVVVGVLVLWTRVEERRLRPGLEKTLDQVIVPAELRLLSEDHWGNRWCFDACPTLTRRYSSPLSMEETNRVFVTEFERLGYECIRYCGQLDGTATWAQPGKRSSELSVAIRLTTDLGKYGDADPKDASRPVHVDLSVQPP